MESLPLTITVALLKLGQSLPIRGGYSPENRLTDGPGAARFDGEEGAFKAVLLPVFQAVWEQEMQKERRMVQDLSAILNEALRTV